MPDVGDIHRFGFRIGPRGPEEETRDVAIFINGENVTSRDSSVYLPSFVGGLQYESRALKRRLNFEKYASVLRDYDLSEIHIILLHGDRTLFDNDDKRHEIASFYRFMELGEPNTDLFVAFLLPANVWLSLTYQCLDTKGGFTRVDGVNGVDNVLPFELIKTIDEAVNLLTST